MSVNLKKHQQNAKKVLLSENNNGLLVFHGLGSGKTLTSIAAASNLNVQTLVIVPASLVNNYKKEIVKYGANSKMFTIVSFEKSAKMNLNLNNKVLVVDEAHRLRNPGRDDARNIIENSKSALKIILLTGTPFVNRPSDIAPLMNIIARQKILPTNVQDFKSMFVKEIVTVVKVPYKMFGVTLYENAKYIKTLGIHNKQLFIEKLKNRVSFFENTDKNNYPSTSVHYKPVEMTHLQSKLHKKIEEENLSKAEIKMLKKNYAIDTNDPESKGSAKRVNAYLSATRKISNIVDGTPSQKVLNILQSVIEAPKPVVVYSNFINHGVKMFQSLLDENNITNRLFTGSVSQKEKKQIVEDYNNRKFDVLCLSRSGSEGLDLKRTRQVHIMEPYWNNSQLDQVIGRAVRFKSHFNMENNKKHVDIFHWYCVYRKSFYGNALSSDEYLVNMSKHKQNLIDQFVDAVKDASV